MRSAGNDPTGYDVNHGIKKSSFNFNSGNASLLAQSLIRFTKFIISHYVTVSSIRVGGFFREGFSHTESRFIAGRKDKKNAGNE
ncbi:MAG: hypothetical protein JJT78_09490 [Leptospira sp.]|nr:hypothetical protein [Leptospira sp.]